MRRAFITQPNVRDQILNIAETMFCERGYGATTIADIASACEMSPANVYRFFESKAALREAITEVVLHRIGLNFRQVAAEPLPAADRIRKLVRTGYDLVLAQCFHNERLHELVETAFDQQLPVIESHIQQIRVIYRDLIEEGVKAGEFAVADIEVASECVFNAAWGVSHPQIVAERLVRDQGRQASQMAEFLLIALTAGVRVDAPAALAEAV